MDTEGETWIGPFEPRPRAMAEVERLADVLTRGGMPTKALRRRARGAVDEADLQRRVATRSAR